MKNQDLVMIFILWGVIGIGSTLFYARAKYETKRRWHLPLVIGIAALFLACGFALQRDVSKVIGVIPAVALIALLNWKMTRFCSQCGSSAFAALGADRFCRRCGASLDRDGSRRN